MREATSFFVDRLCAVGALADKSATQKRGDSVVAHGLEGGRGDLFLNGLDLLAALVIGENTGSYVEDYGRAFLAGQAETQRRIAVVSGAFVLVGSVILWEGGRFIYWVNST